MSLHSAHQNDINLVSSFHFQFEIGELAVEESSGESDSVSVAKIETMIIEQALFTGTLLGMFYKDFPVYLCLCTFQALSLQFSTSLTSFVYTECFREMYVK